jgi:hypothetical protein
MIPRIEVVQISHSRHPSILIHLLILQLCYHLSIGFSVRSRNLVVIFIFYLFFSILSSIRLFSSFSTAFLSIVLLLCANFASGS